MADVADELSAMANSVLLFFHLDPEGSMAKDPSDPGGKEAGDGV